MSNVRDNEHIARLIRQLGYGIEDWTDAASTAKKRRPNEVASISRLEGEAEGFRRAIAYLNYALSAIEQDGNSLA